MVVGVAVVLVADGLVVSTGAAMAAGADVVVVGGAVVVVPVVDGAGVVVGAVVVVPPVVVGAPLVVVGVVVGAAIGFHFRDQPIAWGWTNADNGTLAGLYIVTLTTLATPLIFFAIIEAFVHTQFTRRQGIKMFAICAVNIVAAFAVGLTILNVFQPGTKWRESFERHAQAVAKADGTGSQGASQPASALSLLRSSWPGDGSAP